MDPIEETGISLLEHPQAQWLLAEAQVTAGQGQGCRRRLGRFLERYVPKEVKFQEWRRMALAMLDHHGASVPRVAAGAVGDVLGP